MKFLVLWMKNQRDFMKCGSQIWCIIAVNKEVCDGIWKKALYHVFQCLWTFNISMITFLYVLSRPIIIFLNSTLSSSSQRHPPSCRAGWCSCRGSGDRCGRACCPQRRRAAKREASSSPAKKYVCWYLYFPSYLYFPLYLYFTLKPGFVVSTSSRLKDHSWSRTWLFFAQEVPCPD